MALHGKTGRNAVESIRERKPFTAGGRAYGVANFRGDSPSAHYTAYDLGQLSDKLKTRFLIDYFHGINYIVWSYHTPIAWHTIEDKWVVVDDKFSVSTTGHQSAVRQALS